MLTGSAARARFVTLGLVLLASLAWPCQAASGKEFDWQHGLSFVFDLKYPPGFEHFDYVNPDAPKGGTLRLANSGTWDNFNNFVDKGRDAAGLAFLTYTNLLYDRLLARAADEPTGRYGLLAEAVAHHPDFEWVAFRLREEAYWHDGEPVTAEDVIYSFETYKEHGSVGIRTMLADVERIEQLGPRVIRYVMREGTRNPKIPLTLGDLPVLPKHYWQARDPSKTTLEPPLGSGPYRIKDYDVGRYITWERVPDYWGRDLPVNRGRWNFDIVKWDYFRDENVQREAHKSGVLDVRQETVAKAWAVSYEKVPAMQRGLMKKELLELARPSGLWWAIFWNLREERFQEAELELLEPWRDELPPEVFEREYESVHPDDMSEVRGNMIQTIELFREAGWEVNDEGHLVDAETGERFVIDFIVVSPLLVRALVPFIDMLERVGIESSVRSPEVSNWLYRMRTRSFDAGMWAYSPSNVPGLEVRNRFGSASADRDFGLNWGGIKHPAIDTLINEIIEADTERDFIAATRALDRILMWSFYFIPRSSQPGYRLVYWDRFGIPERGMLQRPAYLDTWWFDPEKSARVDAGIASENGS